MTSLLTVPGFEWVMELTDNEFDIMVEFGQYQYDLELELELELESSNESQSEP